MPLNLAPSELNRPFLTMQWYGVGIGSAAFYRVQEFIGGNWVTQFETAESGAPVYSWTSQLLVDESTHVYQVLAYNSLEQPSGPLEFDITPVVTPPDFVETLYDVTYDGVLEEIVLDLL